MVMTTFLLKLGSLILGLFGISLLVTIHELGHFIFCKLFNVSVPSFSIGFGPALWEKTIGETTFRIAAIPLGGYVEMAGSPEVGQGDQLHAQRTDERSLVKKTYWQKLGIMFGGILFNLLFAYAAAIVIFAIGAPGTPLIQETISAQIESVQDNSIAARAGLQAGDLLMTINNQTIKPLYIAELIKTTLQSPDKNLSITFNREGKVIQKNVDLSNSNETTLGVLFATHPLKPYGFIESIKKGVALVNLYITSTASFIKRLFTHRSLEGAGGPVGIIAAIGKGAQKGFKVYLLLLIAISVNLAILNLLPLPILDGGQALMYTIEAIAGRELPEKIKMGIHIACWLLFLALTLYLTYCDVISLFMTWSSCKG